MTDRFSIHGCEVAVETCHAWLGALAAQGLERMPPTSDRPAGKIEVLLDEGPRQARDGRVTLERSFPLEKGFVKTTAAVWTDRDHLTVIEFGAWATATIDHESRRIAVRVHDRAFVCGQYDPLYTSSVLFKSLLLELLPGFGILPLHAGMCALGRAGVVVCGPPRSGKTRVVCALVAGGAAFMADELGFVLTRVADGPALGAFPIRAKIDPRHARDMVAAGFWPLARGHAGAIVAEPPEPGRTCQRVAPAVLLLVDPQADASSPTAVEAFEAAAWLLTYRTSFTDRHRAAELEGMTALAEKVRAVRIGTALALGPARALLEVVERAAS